MRFDRVLLVAGLVFLVLFTGCSQRVIDFTIISSKNVDLSKAANFKRGTARVEGIDSKPIIFFIPMGTPNTKEAVDRAIESVPGAVALTDGVITYKYFVFIFGKMSYVVEGTPLIDPSLAMTTPNDGPRVSIIDPATNQPRLLEVSESDYRSVKDAYERQDAQAIEGLLQPYLAN
jgi:hypothetical protein